MSSQEVVDFIQSKISQRDENGELRLLSSIVEEVSSRKKRGSLVYINTVLPFSVSVITDILSPLQKVPPLMSWLPFASWVRVSCACSHARSLGAGVTLLWDCRFPKRC